MILSRREFMKAAAAGGMVIAGELWIPGKRLISIPETKPIVFESDIVLASYDFGQTFFKLKMVDVLNDNIAHPLFARNGKPLTMLNPHTQQWTRAYPSRLRGWPMERLIGTNEYQARRNA